MTLYPTSMVADAPVCVCQQSLTDCVSSGLQADLDREARIHHHRQQMEEAMREYGASGCFAARGRADWHRIQFEREIAARSDEQRARMAAEQRARMALEPGAEKQ